MVSRVSGITIMVALIALAPISSNAQVLADGRPFELPDIPDPAPGPSVTLLEAVRQADSGNRSLQALREDINIAAARLQSSWAGLLPSLYGSMGYTLVETAPTTVIGGQAVTGSRNSMNAGLTLKVPLIEARQWLSIDSAKIESDVTELQVEQARQVLLYSVAEAYYQAATALTLITVYRAQFDALSEHLRLAEARMDAGVGNVMDVRSAQTDLVSSWMEIVKAGYALADARDALGILMGTRGQQPMPLVNTGVAGTPETGISDDLLTAMQAGDLAAGEPVAAGVEDRWDIRILNRQVDMLKSELKSGYMPFVPTLSGFFNYSVDVLGNNVVPNSDRDSWNLGLALSMPIFDYTLYPGLKQTKAGIRQAELQIDQIRIEGAVAVAEAGRNVRMLGHIMAAQKVKTVLADDLLDLAEADYANGTGLAIAVTDARRTALSAHVELATATWEYELGRLHLNREMGVDIMKALEGR